MKDATPVSCHTVTGKQMFVRTGRCSIVLVSGSCQIITGYALGKKKKGKGAILPTIVA